MSPEHFYDRADYQMRYHHMLGRNFPSDEHKNRDLYSQARMGGNVMRIFPSLNRTAQKLLTQSKRYLNWEKQRNG